MWKGKIKDFAVKTLLPVLVGFVQGLVYGVVIGFIYLSIFDSGTVYVHAPTIPPIPVQADPFWADWTA